MYAYVQVFLEQVLVSGACNGAHSLKQRLARWLLTMRDRGDDDALQITHNLLAEMLGAHRPSVTNAARELERAGLIAGRGGDEGDDGGPCNASPFSPVTSRATHAYCDRRRSRPRAFRGTRRGRAGKAEQGG